MPATILDGKAVAAALRAEVAREVAAMATAPTLATVLIGDHSESASHVHRKRRLCAAVGIRDTHQHLPADVSAAEVRDTIEHLNADPAISGILVQLPLPAHLDIALVEHISADKDVDGLTETNTARLTKGQPGLRPCTPAGILALLDAYDIPIAGAHAVVIGRSDLVGKPTSALLLQGNATVTICHSQTPDLTRICRDADIVIAATGVIDVVTSSAIKPGATVIDVGIHYTPDGVRGDLDTAALTPIAGAITPVPGGVGPMTIAMLLRNVLAAKHLQTASCAS